MHLLKKIKCNVIIIFIKLATRKASNKLKISNWKYQTK